MDVEDWYSFEQDCSKHHSFAWLTRIGYWLQAMFSRESFKNTAAGEAVVLAGWAKYFWALGAFRGYTAERWGASVGAHCRQLPSLMLDLQSIPVLVFFYIFRPFCVLISCLKNTCTFVEWTLLQNTFLFCIFQSFCSIICNVCLWDKFAIDGRELWAYFIPACNEWGHSPSQVPIFQKASGA